MSKITWSDVIASIDLSDKPVRNPKRLSQDEIADIKTKCNPKYDLTILDLICTIEGYQETFDKLNTALDKAVDMIAESRCPTEKILKIYKCNDFENCLHCWKDWLLGGKEDGKTDI